jgi:hypothetical protein
MSWLKWGRVPEVVSTAVREKVLWEKKRICFRQPPFLSLLPKTAHSPLTPF